MKPIYKLNINKITKSHESVLKTCNDLVSFFKKNDNAEIELDFSDCIFIYPDYSLLLLCVLKYIESIGIIVRGRVIYRESNIVDYLSRMNFFKYLKVEIPEKFKRLSSNRFVEIQQYNADNQLDVLNSIMSVIRENTSINQNVVTGLDYCLNEILDNVLNHSKSEIGWVVAQYFEKINSIRLIVSDYGIGIYKSLNELHDFTEEEAISKSIISGVSNGKGQGHGLYATSSFVKLNKGWLSLISGNKKLDVSSQSNIIKDIPFWQGTCVYLRVNTNVDVDYKEFTSEYFDHKEVVYKDMFE